MAIKILYAEDDPLRFKMTVTGLKSMGYEVDAVTNGQDALNMYDAGEYDLLVLDNQMPEMWGEELLEILRERGDDVPVVMNSSLNHLMYRTKYQPDAWVDKNYFKEADFARGIETAFENVRLRKEKEEQRKNSFWYRLFHGKK